MQIKTGERKYWSLIIFFPIYIGLTGIYPKDTPRLGYTGETRTVFPLVFYCSIIILFKLCAYYIKTQNIRIYRVSNRVICLYLALSLVVATVALMSGSLPYFIAYGQVLSGVMGVVLALWFFDVKKLDFKTAAGFISKLFLLNAIMNFCYEVYKQGFVFFQSRAIMPSTPFYGVYHAAVYYPMIFSLVMFFALPYWREKLSTFWFYTLYTAGLIYVLFYEVRTALLCYLITMFLYVLFFEKNKLLSTILITMAIVFVLIIFTSGMMDTSRISVERIESGIENVGGRSEVYSKFLSIVADDPSYLLFGTLFDLPEAKGFADIGGFVGNRNGFHNQYFEAIADGGVAYLALFMLCVFSVFTTVNKNKRKMIGWAQKDFSFWIMVICVELCVDLFFQVPLKVTNPAIHYWFFWIGLSLYSKRCTQSIYQLDRTLFKFKHIDTIPKTATEKT